jgi:hypothetical protein
MDTGMSITHRDAVDASNTKGVDSMAVRQRVLPQEPLVGAHVAGAVRGGDRVRPEDCIPGCLSCYRIALPIKTAILSPRPRDFDKASAATVGSHRRCGFHGCHAYCSRIISLLYFVSGKRGAWTR